MKDIDEFQERLFAWSGATFGNRDRPDGPLNHLKKECDEAIANPDDIMEFADMQMLLCDAASRAGHKMSAVLEAAERKLEICRKRKWEPLNEAGFSEHVRDD